MAECECSWRHSQNRQPYLQEQHPVLLYEFPGQWGSAGADFRTGFSLQSIHQPLPTSALIQLVIRNLRASSSRTYIKFKSQNNFPEFLNMTSTLSACRCHGDVCGNEHNYSYWKDFSQIWYRFMHIKSRQANTILFHVVLISKPFFTTNSKYILTNFVKTKRPY